MGKLERDIKVEWVSPSSLKPYARNARTHSAKQIDQIAASIKEFGWTQPLIVDEEGILAGHGRLAAAIQLNLEKVPVIHLEGLTDAKRKALILADNKIALNAGWDQELLTLELRDLGEARFDLETTGFSTEELTLLLPEDEEQSMPGGGEPPEIPFERRFKLFERQRDIIDQAIDLATSLVALPEGTENPTGASLAVVCEFYLDHHARNRNRSS